MRSTMRQMIGVVILAGCCVILAGCEGPTFVMSGGELSGPIAEVPSTWQFEEISELAQLETRPSDPYSINLVYVQLDGKLYIYAGDTRTNWVQHIEQDPSIRLRINGTVYPARADRVIDSDELNTFAEIWSSRSVFQRDPRNFEEVWLYRVVAR